LRDKRFIENRPLVSDEMIKWNSSYKSQLNERKLLRAKSALEEKIM